MSSPLHSQATYNGIRQRVRCLCCHNDGGVTPPLPPNDVPHPDALHNSAVYYPLLLSVATAQLNYLYNSLAHPSISGPLSFHAVVLSSNYRTHVFNANLAELQGPDGIPISSRVGHAIIFFFPGEHEHESEADESWNHLLRPQLACLEPEDTGPATSAYEEDSDDEDNANGPGILAQNQEGAREDEEERDEDRGRGMLARPLPVNETPEEGETREDGSQSNDTVHSYVYRIRYDYQGKLMQSSHTFPIPRAIRRIPPPPHPALPASFVLPVQQIISVKHDEARGVFRVPRDYSMRMSIDEDELRILKRGLPVLIAVRLDFIMRTLVRVSNQRGSALILHNPVYLDMMQRMLYPRRVDLYSPPTAQPVIEMPKFRATVFVLETYKPTEVNSSESASEEDDEKDEKSKKREEDEEGDPESRERDLATSKKRRVETDEDQLMYPASPSAVQGTERYLSLDLSEELTKFINITDENFRPPTPIPSLLLQPSAQDSPSEELTSTLSQMEEDTGEISASSPDPKIFTTQLEVIQIPPADPDIEMGETTGRLTVNPLVVAPEGQYRGRATQTQEEEEEEAWSLDSTGDEWNGFDSEMENLTSTEPTLSVDPKLTMTSIPTMPNSSIASSTSLSPLYASTRSWDTEVETSSDESRYETSDSSPPSSYSSMPSLASDDSDAYSPLSLEELTRGNLKSKVYVIEPVRLSRETMAALDNLPNEPRHFACRTSNAVGHGDSNALTYAICQHDDAGNLIYEPAPALDRLPLPFPSEGFDSEFTFEVMKCFQGPCDNSPLQNGSGNELVNPFGAAYDSLQGLDEYKIATLALKIHELIMDLDVDLDQWDGMHPRLTGKDLDSICLIIFRAHTERARLIDIGEWRRNLIMQGIADAPASTRIVSFSDAGWTNTRVNGNSQMNPEDDSEASLPPSPRVLIFLRSEEMKPGKEHIANALRNRETLETYKPLDDEPAYSFLDPNQSPFSEVFKNPWIPIIAHIRIVRLFIHRLLGLICKQFLTMQWRRAVDRLSPEDKARHFLYYHNDIFHYLLPSLPSYFQGFHHRCLHVNPSTNTLRVDVLPRNPLLTANEDKFIFHAASLFEFEGRGELANALRFAHAAEPILPMEVRALFTQGYAEPVEYYDCEGRHCAFRGDELDLCYYSEED
ncbi:uncharacterized protein EV420DRAFT_1648572 [Desarmillaria tabescens]|uniref:Uncharacterized protein n=1 Tax=Armillaria tabescens TaxID=1929756 RepID=A0AA39MSJ4_ARMTA|nr:uncharacterized protein EV420DRAFT_1648572 [Desarmillaria tabescens]KAK0445052.1 hypothetical protein EV420DRAFT_1648572 [Desarmillaria tabescens]